MTDDELKQIARDIATGHVFTDRMFPNDMPPEQIAIEMQHIFLPLALLDAPAREKLMAEDPKLFFEYYNKAGPRTTNGYPQFMTVRYISGEDWPRFKRYIEALRDAPDPLENL